MEKYLKVGLFGLNDRRRLNGTCLHDYLEAKIKNGYKIKESLGTYYSQDRISEKNLEAGATENDENPSEVSPVNKNEIRVITYKIDKPKSTEE